MRKEMDELRNAIKEKADRSLDRMIRATDSPFTTAVLECPMPSKFRLPQLEPFNGLKDPQDHLNTFKMTLGLQQPPDKILCRSFRTTLKGATREWFIKLPTSSIWMHSLRLMNLHFIKLAPSVEPTFSYSDSKT